MDVNGAVAMVKARRLWVVMGALVALGCGTSDKSPAAAGQAAGGQSGSFGTGASAGSGGNAVDGGSAGSAGQGAGGAALGDSNVEACIAYAMAVCSRRVECLNGSIEEFPLPGCIVASLGCPDLAFSPGATRTVEGLKACAEDYRTWPCDKVVAGELPPCVTPGQRAQGEPCVYASQCSSLNCESVDGCGQCALEAGEGESCAAPDVDCANHLSCSANQQCETRVVVLPPAGPNEPCVIGQACVADYFCDATLVCSPLPRANESCAGYPSCGSGAYCPAALTCLPLPGMGEPCGIRVADNAAIHCQESLTCHFAPDAMSGTCLPFPKLGEPCIMSPFRAGYGYCEAGLRCDTSVSPALCAALGRPGDTCATEEDCEGTALCKCPDDALECVSNRCIALRLADESCNLPNVQCHPGFACTDGVCQPLELQGTFATTCGG